MERLGFINKGRRNGGGGGRVDNWEEEKEALRDFFKEDV